MKTAETASRLRPTLVPHADIESVLAHERRYLHAFFEKLNEEGVSTLGDLMNRTEEELFAIAPTSKSNRERFLYYVRSGIIALKE